MCFVFYLLSEFFGLKCEFLTCLIIRCTAFNLLILATIFKSCVHSNGKFDYVKGRQFLDQLSIVISSSSSYCMEEFRSSWVTHHILRCCAGRLCVDVLCFFMFCVVSRSLIHLFLQMLTYVKVEQSLYRPGRAQRVRGS